MLSLEGTTALGRSVKQVPGSLRNTRICPKHIAHSMPLSNHFLHTSHFLFFK